MHRSSFQKLLAVAALSGLFAIALVEPARGWPTSPRPSPPSEGGEGAKASALGKFTGLEQVRKEQVSSLAQEVGWEADSSPADGSDEAPQQRGGGRGGFGTNRVFKAQITPHWFQDNTKFWYRNDLRGGAKEFVLVDAEKGTRLPAFDHQKLAAALSKAAEKEFKADQLPFADIEFSGDGKTVQFEAADKIWKCDLVSYECSQTKKSVMLRREAEVVRITSEGRASEWPTSPRPSPPSEGGEGDGEHAAELLSQDASPMLESEAPQEQQAQRQGRGQGQRRGGQFGQGRQAKSPDGKWTAFIKDQNVFVRSEEDAKEFQLSQDGETNNAYGRIEWAADSKAFVGWRITPGDEKLVYLFQSSPPGGGPAYMQSRPYPQAGDKFTAYELSVFDPANHKQIKPKVEAVDFGFPRIRWSADHSHFTYEKVDRGHQRFRVIEVDARTGGTRNLIDEQTKTFIWTAHTEELTLSMVNYLEKTPEIIYVSEQDGWRHLYLIDAQAGKLKNQITKGEWVVRGIDKIDEDARQIWFRACGKNPGQDPYLMHFYRINFDGTGLIALTEGDGTHTIAYSPDRRFIIDTYSRVNLAPVNELRRVADGKLVCGLEKADVGEAILDAPEVFVAKGRDGKTDIWGIITRPSNFDPSKKYPILEDIYAGPQSSFVPKSYSAARRYGEYNDLGFVVVKMDGMGTANRSKAFHDTCWHNLKDAGFEDRILWIKAAAAKYPYLDLARVGVFGTSAGGQNAAGAVLFHPEFYKAAVANCGCHDNRLDKASWNEQWMGYPVGPWYSESSNIDNAAKLKGKLFLIVGEMDTNVPPESTLRFADALIRAGKDFDLLVVPGADHGVRGPAYGYAQRRTRDFFVRTLLAVMPFCHLTLKCRKPLNCSYLYDKAWCPTELKHIGDHIKKRRFELKMMATECQKLFGVDKSTLTNWENGYHRPSPEMWSKIVTFLGYEPKTDIPTTTEKYHFKASGS